MDASLKEELAVSFSSYQGQPDPMSQNLKMNVSQTPHYC